ncbi:MAG: hypothetical protein GY817_03290 [bacterium]|nr:hypothetical protein [bacterium]
MKKILFFNKKNTNGSNIELNEHKLYKKGFELSYEHQLKNLETMLKSQEIFYIIVDGLNKAALDIIHSITPTQNVLIVLDNTSEVKGVNHDKINFKFFKKPYSTNDLMFIMNQYNKNITDTTNRHIGKFFSDLMFDLQNTDLDIYDKLYECLKFITNFLSADSGSIMLLNNDKNKLNVEVLIGNPAFTNSKIDTHKSFASWVLEHKKSVIINKSKAIKNIKQYLTREDINSSVNILLENNSELMGIININSSGSRIFKKQDLIIAKYFAAVLAMLIDYANIIKRKDLEIFDLHESNKEMENFVYSAFHDIKTPLFTLQGFLDTFKKKYYEKLDPEGIKYLMLASNGASRLGKMLNDVFEFFKFAKLKYSFIKTDMSEIVNLVLDQLQILLNEEDIQIHKKQFENSKIFIIGQTNYLITVWTNLISNAIKYRNENIPLNIELGFKDDGGDMLTFFIQDNGIGIDEKEFNFIFKLFARSMVKEIEGTGVGLAIVKKIIDKHGGNIWLDSKLNKGTTFYFSIPKYSV